MLTFGREAKLRAFLDNLILEGNTQDLLEDWQDAITEFSSIGANTYELSELLNYSKEYLANRSIILEREKNLPENIEIANKLYKKANLDKLLANPEELEIHELVSSKKKKKRNRKRKQK